MAVHCNILQIKGTGYTSRVCNIVAIALIKSININILNGDFKNLKTVGKP
jgi:hypothetical protein